MEGIILHFPVSAKRFEIQENGESIPISIDEPIQIGVFTKHPSQVYGETSILYLNHIQINNNQMDINIVTDELPKYISIDPLGTRSDKNLLDNLKSL